ncbi:uncharacterized protein BO95DRAFT_427678 [Aspergillus brunneoviolaceus CBS 621.78]|uniref:Uncharacterized protein n=1 Tax=Aspergillus brunneoviolaceus CBS 621.78 TaxID=1450534 RepID=A0ACD1GLH8_9EURO|nr:hypothetical protein BO95DRAFT_427678 [Aspergillus brunneoviolaceus CBS 621.78]RAH50204.1 hypothetical protein BO95DRAFT_427678 [Aspergillus brunneoviolaceus CBS 621.78]
MLWLLLLLLLVSVHGVGSASRGERSKGLAVTARGTARTPHIAASEMASRAGTSMKADGDLLGAFNRSPAWQADPVEFHSRLIDDRRPLTLELMTSRCRADAGSRRIPRAFSRPMPTLSHRGWKM